MDAKLLISISKEGIATLILNRVEKRNALDGEMVEALTKKLAILSHDPAVRVLVIQGHGEHFCAGADITWMKKMASVSAAENQDDAEKLANLFLQLYHFPKPTMVLAHGAILGGGLGLVAAADIAIAAESAFFGFSEVKLGLAPFVISPYIISIIGERAAHYYFLTGEQFSSQKAHELKLIHRVVKEVELLHEGLMLAETLLGNGPEAMSAIKTLLRSIKPITNPALMQATASKLAAIRQSDEAKEGLNAFLERRKPNWS